MKLPEQGETMYRLTKRIMTATLALTISGAAVAQTQPGMPDIQKLTSNAMKLSIGLSAAGAGVAVIGFLVKHHHHKKASEISSPVRQKPNASMPPPPTNMSAQPALAGTPQF
jgi:hypothetical protein